MTTRKRINLREDVLHQPAAMLVVDESAGIVKGVKVLGYDSKNGRRYLKEAVAAAMAKYDQAKVNVDHVGADAAGKRKFADRFGRLCNFRTDPHGLWADLKFNPAHQQAPAFVWWAKNDPNAIGLSHNALGEVEEQADGSLVVTEIIEVYSVDLVADPATTKGLQESHMDPLTNDTPDALAAPPVPPPEPTPGEEGYESHIGKLVAAIMVDTNLDIAAKRAKLLAALKLLDDAPKPAPKPKDDEPKGMEEEFKRLRARLDAYELREQLDGRRARAKDACRKAGLPDAAVTEVFLEQMATAKDDAATKVLIEDRKRIVGSGRKPVSTGQGSGAEMSVDDFVAALVS